MTNVREIPNTMTSSSKYRYMVSSLCKSVWHKVVQWYLETVQPTVGGVSLHPLAVRW